MSREDEEERLLRSVALQNAQSILLARQHAEEELVRATERMEQTTVELAHSLGMIRATLESTTDGILVTDGEGRVTGFNEKFTTMWQLPRDVVTSADHRELFNITGRAFESPEDFRERVEEIYRISPIESYDLLKLADRRVFERFSRIQFVDGQNMGRVWSFRDVTDSKRAEEILRTSEARKTAILDTALDSIITFDHLGHILEFNRAAERTFGFRRVDILGRDMAELIVPPSLRAKHREGIARYLATGEGPILNQRIEMQALRSDGTEFPAELAVTCIPSEEPPIFTAYLRDITERKTAERALHKQSEWLRVTLTSIGDAVITTDALGKIISLNPVAEAMTGWSRQEAWGKPLETVFRIISEQSRHPIENAAVKALRGELIEGLSNHAVLISKNNIECAIDASAAPIRDDHGDVIGAILIFRDITQRRLAEETRTHLASVVASSGDAIISMDLDGHILTWNDTARRMFGYLHEEVVGRPISIVLPTERLEDEIAVLRRLRRGERIDPFDTVRLRKDGSPIHVSITISPIHDASGHVVGASKIARDITDRIKAERTTRFLADSSAALAELTDFRSTLERVAQLAVPIFADWCAVDMREPSGAVRRLAVTHSEPAKIELARELFHRFPPRPSDAYGIMNVLRTGQSEWNPEIPDALLLNIVHNEEHLRILRQLGLKSYICVPLRSREQILGVLTFVTAESGRQYDATDLAAAEDLAHRAVIAIQNASLMETLREADHRKDEFLAMLAHELRNPLAPIRNAVQILRLTSGTEPAVQTASDMMERQLGQMVRLVDDLLDVSRISRGRIELRWDQIDLAAVIEQAVETVRPLVESRKHELIVSLPDSPLIVRADPLRLAQIVGNLLTNACKFTAEGGHIQLSVQRESELAVIRVRDDGIGIPADKVSRIFEIFTQLETSLERTQSGLGIGLTLVRKLIELHGGSVEVHSPGPGMGSEFIVRLPIVTNVREAANELDSTVPELSQSPATLHPPPSRGRRIVIVDDNRDSASTLAMLLTLEGHETHTANDGLEAVETITRLRPDIVLLDIGLPKLNGYEVARRIRAEPWGRQIVLIALTGWGQAEDRKRSKEAGFDEHFVKPVDLNALNVLLARSTEAPF